MGKIIRADNRTLIKDVKYTYLTSNIVQGVSSIDVSNTSGFSANDYITIGNIGSSNTEIAQISAVTDNNTLALVSTTKFAHAESSRITIIGYNKVRFFWTAAPVVPNPSSYPVTETSIDQIASITSTKTKVTTSPSTAIYTKSTDPTEVEHVDITPPILLDYTTPLALVDIEADKYLTTYQDSSHSTGYGWVAFYNTTTAIYSSPSSAIPYAGFPSNTVREIFESFDSMLNAKDIKSISVTDKYTWLNEGASYAVNELNLGNWEYCSSGPRVLTVTSSVAEYLLPPDFSDMLYINDSDGYKINHYNQTFEPAGTYSDITYEIRGRYLVFYPTPTSNTTVTLAYLKNSSTANDYSDVIDLPNNFHMNIKDYMLFRAYKKLGDRQSSMDSLTLFKDSINRMKTYSINRDNGLNSWNISNSQNV
jgi:hypothetical protein